jgi:hypothetical protein
MKRPPKESRCHTLSGNGKFWKFQGRNVLFKSYGTHLQRLQTRKTHLLAPFLLVAIPIAASDRKLMQGQPSSRLGWTVVAITTVAMFAAGVAMFVV